MFRFSLPEPDSSLLLNPQWSSLSGSLQPALLLLVCLVPLALILWLYRYELKLIHGGVAALLLVLRLVALAVILFLLCLQPVYARDRSEELPGRILVLIDRSDSLEIADPQRPVADKLRLARGLRLHAGACPDEVIAGWITAHEQGKSPEWLTADEAKADAKQRGQREDERRKLHDDLCAKVDALTRSEVAQRVLTEPGLDLFGKLAKRHAVDLVAFHRDAWEVKPEKLTELFAKPEPKKEGDETAAALGQRGPSAYTDLRLPLLRAQEMAAPGQGKVLGVILLTDGQHNYGDPPVKKARELGNREMPVFPIALGARQPPPDVAVVAVKTPAAVFKDVEVPVEIDFKVTGLPEQDLTVSLYHLGKEKKLLEERTVKHDGKTVDYTERFQVRLADVGPQNLLATVKPTNPATKEIRTDNNSWPAVVNIADDKAKVLVIDGEARWEFHYLATALERDRTMKLERVVFDQPRLNASLTQEQLQKLGSPRQDLPAGPDALADFDCIILGDVSPEQMPLPERVRLEKYVAERGGTLVLLAGKRWMPLAYPELEANGEPDPLRKLLPIEGPRPVTPGDGFRVTLTQRGRETKFMDMERDPRKSLERWASLPPHQWGVVGQAKKGATTLAWVPPVGADPNKTADQDKSALAALHSYGFGRVLFVGLDSTWRWRFRTGDTYHHRFWGQTIRWAAAEKPLVTGNEFVRFGTPHPVYNRDENIDVVVRLNEEAGPLKADLLAGARILRLGDEKDKEESVALVPLAKRPAQPRVLEGILRDLPPGRYAIELVIPDLADKLIDPASVPGSEIEGKPKRNLRAGFTVLPAPSREMLDLETRYPLLEEIAAKSGGKVFNPEDAGELAEMLTAKSVKNVEHHEQRLWQWWVMLAVVLSLLTVEWVARKWSGLP
jgi:hypothetical protein